MSLTYGDLAQLEHRLIGESSEIDLECVENVLEDIVAWYEEADESGQDVVDATDFAALCAYARGEAEERIRRLAIGALVLLVKEEAGNPKRSRIVVRFALHRIRGLEGKAPLWSGVELSDADREDAEALFEAAIGDASFSDSELVESARVYSEDHAQDGGLFGRLAADLEFLVQVFVSPDDDASRKERARAALTYFALVADAIPDNLGLVGLLDDIYVVNSAVIDLQPERGAISAFLDKVLSHWPFVSRISLGDQDGRYSLSEYSIVTAALLLEDVREQSASNGTAVVAPEVGPLGFIVGFVRAIAEIASYASREVHPSFEYGEVLVNRGTKKQIKFLFYGYLVGYDVVPCPADEATHFKFLETQSKKGREDIERSRPVGDVYSFQRTSEDRQGRKRGSLDLNADELPVGPLERLLGIDRPIVLPKRRGRVVVVAGVGATKYLAKKLRLFGVPVQDVLPMGAMVYKGEDYEFRTWTTSGAGGAPMLTVVPRPIHALEMAEDPDANVIAVVSPVRRDSRDATNLARIAGEGIDVVAFVEESDVETHDHFEGEDFGFWIWTEGLLKLLHWPREHVRTDHPVARLERSIRSRLESEVAVERLDLDGLSEAIVELEALERMAGEDSNAHVSRFLEDSYRCFLQICRRISPVTPEWAQLLRTTLTGMKRSLAGQPQWWSRDTLSRAASVVKSLLGAIDALELRNPKFDQLLQWAQREDSRAVICNGRMRDELGGHIRDTEITIGSVPRMGYVRGSALIPAWLGRNRMDRLLSPPIATDTRLLLYGPEQEWFRAWTNRNHQFRQRVRQLAKASNPLAGMVPATRSLPESRVEITPVSSCPDEIVLRARRRRVLAGIGSGSSDSVAARLVHFAGGSWAAFLPRHELPTLTNLVDADLDEVGEEDYVQSQSVEDLQSGELVLLVRGSGHDAIRAVVDMEDGVVQLRRIATRWQVALRKYVHRGSSLEALRRRLAECGCKRSAPTVRRWLESERIIGPRHGLSDIEAICEATGDAELGAGVEECYEAISQLRGLHLKAARSLTEKVMDRTRLWLDAGAAPDEVVEVEDRLVLVTVESVDTELVDVPSRLVNRLQET